jgi:hypothetical protein
MPLEDTAVRCICGYQYQKTHIEITAVHPKHSGMARKDRKRWVGKTGDFILEVDYKNVNITPVEAGWYGGIFIPDEPPSEPWLQNAIKYKETSRK